MTYEYLFVKYFPRAKNTKSPHFWPDLERDRWRQRKGEPGLWSQQRSMGKRIGCMRCRGARVVYHQTLTGQLTTITYPDLQKWMWECL